MGFAGRFLRTDRAESQQSTCIGLWKPETLRHGLKVIEGVAPWRRKADWISRLVASRISFHDLCQPMADRADIPDAENNLAGQFVLNGKVVVLRVRHRKSRIEDV